MKKKMHQLKIHQTPFYTRNKTYVAVTFITTLQKKIYQPIQNIALGFCLQYAV